MGSLISKANTEDMESPDRDSILKRIEDPRSPTEEINRTPIEVADKVSKDKFRHLAFTNALKQQNQVLPDSSPLSRKLENCERDIKVQRNPFSNVLESTPILYAEESNISLDVSAIEKENAQ